MDTDFSRNRLACSMQRGCGDDDIVSFYGCFGTSWLSHNSVPGRVVIAGITTRSSGLGASRQSTLLFAATFVVPCVPDSC
jgi:hypothetical protein